MPTVTVVESIDMVGTPFLVDTGSGALATIRVLRPRHAALLQLTDGLEALGSTVELTPRHEEPVATGSSLASYPRFPHTRERLAASARLIRQRPRCPFWLRLARVRLVKDALHGHKLLSLQL